ncbi:MAG: hypothetical protein R3B37_03675 [Nitrospira sp.]|nr:hypothetical protein [Nitrospira sp.]
MRQLYYGGESKWFALFLGGVEQVSTEAWWFKVPVFILSAGVLSALGGDPTLISHSEAMGVAVGTLILRGIWVLMRRFSVPMSYLVYSDVVK